MGETASQSGNSSQICFLRETPEGQDERHGKEGGWRYCPHPCEVLKRGKERLNKEWEGQGGCVAFRD